MSLFKKKRGADSKSGIPELPELPKMPGLPEFPRLDESFESRPRIQGLPSFSGSKSGDSLSQQAIKSAVSPEEPENMLMGLEPSISSGIEPLPPIRASKTRLPELPNFPYNPPSRITRKIEPVYIRIDKFESAIQSFLEMKEKISEIEAFLREIKEIKQKEEEELREWERELETIKARIDIIDKNIFSKLD